MFKRSNGLDHPLNRSKATHLPDLRPERRYGNFLAVEIIAFKQRLLVGHMHIYQPLLPSAFRE